VLRRAADLLDGPGHVHQFGSDDCADCTLECGHGADLWQGQMALLRIDPLEPQIQQGFRIANVRLTADDEPDASAIFPNQWTSTGPFGHRQSLLRHRHEREQREDVIRVGAQRERWSIQLVRGRRSVGPLLDLREIADSAGNAQGR